jgi:2-polyprenyl-3-methyl-5-hydroxy-6-metoxy-1,4-benzoquinol methylase
VTAIVSTAPVDRQGDAIAIGGDYQHRARTEGFVVQRYWHWEKERMIRKFSAPSPGDRVLDVGCGSGVIADVLASSGASTIGIDGNPDAIAYASRTFQRPNLEFRQSLVEEIAEPEGSIDRIYCFELVEHIYEHQVERLLQTMHRLTRPGGTLTLTTPNFRGTWPVLERTLDLLHLVPHLDGDQHVTHFHRRRLHDVLLKTGWHVERLRTFSTFAPFSSVLGWGFAERISAIEDRLDLPFGNILFATAIRS